LNKTIFYATVLFTLAILAFFAYGDVKETQFQASPWMDTVVTREEFTALEWIRVNTLERAVFVTDIFGGELIMGETLREGVEGGDWAVVPGVVKRMHDVQYEFYGSTNAKQAWNTARKYGAEYAWIPNRRIFAGYEWKTPLENNKEFENSTFFEKVFDNGVKIYKVK